MKVLYQPSNVAAMWYVFHRPSSVDVSGDNRVGPLEFNTIVDAIGVVATSVVVKYKRAVKATSAQNALNVVSGKFGFDRPFGDPLALDRAHLQSWGFYWSDEKVQDISEAVLDALDSDSPETVVSELLQEVEVRTVEKERAQKQAVDRKAAGQLMEAEELEAEVQRHAHRLEVLSMQLQLLKPGGLLRLESPESPEPSSGSTELSVAAGSGGLDERIAAAADQEEKVKERVEELCKQGLIFWIYGTPDELICYVKPKMSIQQRLLYIRSKNPDPSPVEFAKLFMEINSEEHCLEPGRNAFAACKAAHKKHDPSFSYDDLPESQRNEYRVICYQSSSCAVCGKSIVGDKTHCSNKCADNACECCNGPLELKVESREVINHVRCTSIQNLEDLMQLRGAEEPQEEEYHSDCEAKVRSSLACNECQEKRYEWSLRCQQWDNLAREPESFWAEKQQQLKELLEMPEKTTIVRRKRVCTGGCSGEQRSDKRSRDADQRHREMVEGLDVGAKRRRTES